MRMRVGIAFVGLLLALGGCSSSGPSTTPSGSAAGPVNSVAATPAPSVASVGASEGARPSPAAVASTGNPTPFALTSSAFQEGGEIPSRFTCDGANVSPALAWAGAPDGTKTLALVVFDSDANYTHWVAYDMAGTPAGGLPEDATSTASDALRQGMNDFGKAGYGGPCPPSGTHHYHFTVYALDGMLAMTGTPKMDDLVAAMKGHVLAKVMLTGTYRRH